MEIYKQKIIKKYKKLLAPDCIKAYRPRLFKSNNDKKCSKLGGVPFLTKEYEWYKCESCGEKSHLIVQLNLEELPVEFKDYGLIQLFGCCCEGADYNNFIRIIFTKENNSIIKIKNPPDHFLEEKIIEEWIEFKDYPSFAELNLDLTTEESDILFEENIYPDSGEKLGGYPNSVDSSEEQYCEKCNKQMKYIFQIDSEDFPEGLFSHSGVGHIFQCIDHKEIVLFDFGGL